MVRETGNAHSILPKKAMKQTFQKYWWQSLGALALAAGFACFVAYQEAARTQLTVAFLDVGQGDAIFIQTPSGTQVLFDGGPDGSVLSGLGTVMPFYDRSIDMLVVTNPDKDHIAGFIDVLDQYRVGTVLEPGTRSSTETYKALEGRIDERGIQHLLARSGMRFVLDRKRSIYIDILYPDRDVATFSSNDGSIMARLVYDHTEVMLTGDATAKAERFALESGADLHADILKVGHHGSRTSTSESFLDAVNPELAVISSGRDNSYGHPHREVTERLGARAVPYLVTAQEGAIIIQSDGKTFWRKD